MTTTTKKAEMAKILMKIDALKFGVFKLTSGKASPYYIDLRIVPSFPDSFQRICESYVKFIKTEIGADNVDRIAGIPVSGVVFASIVAFNLKKPFLYARKGERHHGRERRIEGVMSPGDRVLLLDDLVTTGLSLQKAAKAIVAEGGVVTDCVALLDRQEGGKERLRKSGVKLHSLLSIMEIADTLHELGAIDEEQLKTILKQVKKK